MSDTVKLIIEIPKAEYERLVYIDHLKLRSYIENGTPLDGVKAEIQKMPTDYCGGYIGLDKNEVLKILDNVGKAERR